VSIWTIRVATRLPLYHSDSWRNIGVVILLVVIDSRMIDGIQGLGIWDLATRPISRLRGPANYAAAQQSPLASPIFAGRCKTKLIESQVLTQASH